MSYPLPHSLQVIGALGETLAEIAAQAARAGVNQVRPAPARRRRGKTLRPGADTPLWIALVDQVRPLLTVYGAKANLGRELQLHGSRITEFFIRKSAMPDAERTLELLLWLARQRDSSRAATAGRRKTKTP